MHRTLNAPWSGATPTGASRQYLATGALHLTNPQAARIQRFGVPRTGRIAREHERSRGEVCAKDRHDAGPFAFIRASLAGSAGCHAFAALLALGHAAGA